MKEEFLQKQILFIGAGKMGLAIIKNLIKSGFLPQQIKVVKPSKNNQIAKIKYFTSISNLPKNYQADIVFFAFKPQMAEEILLDFTKQNQAQNTIIPENKAEVENKKNIKTRLREIKAKDDLLNLKTFNSQTIFISILAGKKITFFEQFLGQKAKIIRLMPNLPILINQGVSGYCFNAQIKKSDKKILKPLLDFIGDNIFLKKENLIDSITAISGSGPAYLFLFSQFLIESAIKLGLEAKTAENLVKKTIYGSAKMLLDSNQNLPNLIKNVASKGGTTEAALEVFHQDNQFREIIFKATKKAQKRAEELSK